MMLLTCVDNGETHLAVRVFCGDRDPPIAGGKLYRVADEIRQHLLNPCRVGENEREIFVDAGLEPDCAADSER